MQTKYNKITHVKFILSVFVILIHSYNLLLFGGVDNSDLLYYIETYLSLNISQIAVPMFFFISGYLFFVNIENNNQVILKLKNRIKSIGVPYLFWNTIHTIIFLIIFQIPVIKQVMSNTDNFTIPNFLRGVLCYKYLYPYWYIANLLCFFVLTPIIFYILKNIKAALVVLVGLLLVNILGVQYKEMRIWELFYFYFGGFVGIYCKQYFMHRFKKKTSTLALLGLLIINAIGIFCTNRYLLRAFVLIGMICFWVFMDMFADYKCYIYEKQSFFIYSMHLLVLETIQKLNAMIGDMRIIGFIDYIISPIICMLVIYIVYRALNKFVPNFYKLINGAR